jgi:hypothetical protein
MLLPVDRVKRFLARFAVAPLCMLAIAASARADIVVLTTPAPQRSVSAQATIGGTSDSSSISFDQGGDFNNNASASVTTGGIASANADQASTIPDLTGPAMKGSGSAFGSALPDSPNSGSYSASSFFDVFFTVDTTDTYKLTGFVSYLEPQGPNGGTSSLTLTNEDSSSTLFSVLHSESDPGLTNFDQNFAFTAGVTYRLIVQVSSLAEIVNPDVFSFGGGSFQFNLASASLAVPEPSALVLVVCGLAAAPVALRHSRRRAA